MGNKKLFYVTFTKSSEYATELEATSEEEAIKLATEKPNEEDCVAENVHIDSVEEE